MATKVNDSTAQQTKNGNIFKRKWAKAKRWFKKKKPVAETLPTAASPSVNDLSNESFDEQPIDFPEWDFSDEEQASISSLPIVISPNDDSITTAASTSVNDLSNESFDEQPIDFPLPEWDFSDEEKASISSLPIVISPNDDLITTATDTSVISLCDEAFDQPTSPNPSPSPYLSKDESSLSSIPISITNEVPNCGHDVEIGILSKMVSDQQLLISGLEQQITKMVTKEWHEAEMYNYVLDIISEHNANLQKYQLDDGANEYAKKEENLIDEHIKEMNFRNNIISNQRREISMLKNDLFSLPEIHHAEMAQRDRMISDLKDEIETLRAGRRATADAMKNNQPNKSSENKPQKTPFRNFKSSWSKGMRQTKETLWTKPIAQLNNRPLNDPTNEWANYPY